MITASDIAGHWVRHWIKTPEFEDHSTRVHWMQAGLDYADVRIPVERPDLSEATCLADLTCSDLALLAHAEGFAGYVTLEGDHCTWHREINWHGPPEMPDVGAISFDDQGRLIEAGVHAAYTELWEQQATAPSTALRVEGGGYQGLLLRCGDACVLGIGQPDSAATSLLRAALEAGQLPKGIERLFDGLHAVGTWANGQMIAQLATNPFAQGQPVVTQSGHGLIWHRIGFGGTRSDIQMQAAC